MIPSPREIKDAERAARGLPIGYLDRVRKSLPELCSDSASEIELALPISDDLKMATNAGDWDAVWGHLRAHPASAISLAAYATAGMVRDARMIASRILGRDTDHFIYGRLRAASREGNTATALIDVPGKNGHHHVLEIAFTGSLEKVYDPGDAIRIQKRQGPKGIYYRLANPVVHTELNADGSHIESMPAADVAAVVRAQYGDHPFCGNWERVDIREQLKAIDPKIRPSKFGLYQHRETSQAILVFRGTEPLDVRDWLINVATTHGNIVSDYKLADQVASWAKRQFGSVLLAGHSKGGGAAQYAAAKTNMRAVCFNSVGLPKSVMERMDLKDISTVAVDSFALRGDWVSNVGGKYRADGMGIAGPLASHRSGQFMLGTEDSFRILDTNYSRWQVWSLHSIDSMVNALEKEPHILKAPFARRPPSQAIERVESLRENLLAASDRTPFGRLQQHIGG